MAVAALVTLSVVDLRSYRLPDAIVLPASGVGAMIVVAVSLIIGRPGAAVAAMAAALGYGTLMLTVHEICPRGLGFGDVKLAPLLGLHLGWTADVLHGGWLAVTGLVVQGLLISSSVGLMMGLAVAGLRCMGREALPDPGTESDPGAEPDPGTKSDPGAELDPGAESGGMPVAAGERLLGTGFPFGPALAAGTLIAVLFSEYLLA